MINDKLIILWVFFEVKNAITNFLNPLDIYTHTHTHTLALSHVLHACDEVFFSFSGPIL